MASRPFWDGLLVAVGSLALARPHNQGLGAWPPFALSLCCGLFRVEVPCPWPLGAGSMGWQSVRCEGLAEGWMGAGRHIMGAFPRETPSSSPLYHCPSLRGAGPTGSMKSHLFSLHWTLRKGRPPGEGGSRGVDSSVSSHLLAQGRVCLGHAVTGAPAHGCSGRWFHLLPGRKGVRPAPRASWLRTLGVGITGVGVTLLVMRVTACDRGLVWWPCAHFLGSECGGPRSAIPSSAVAPHLSRWS